MMSRNNSVSGTGNKSDVDVELFLVFILVERCFASLSESDNFSFFPILAAVLEGAVVEEVDASVGGIG